MDKTLSFLQGLGAMSPASALNPATAALAAAQPAFQLVTGAIQKIQGDRLAKTTTRPTLTMQPAQEMALASARAAAYGPGQAWTRYKALQGANRAQSFNAARQSGGGSAERLATLALMGNQEGMRDMQMAAQAAQEQQRNMGIYRNELNRAADTQREAWDYNVNQPYQNTMSKASQLRDSGIKNISGGLTGVGGALASGITGQEKAPGIGTSASTGLMGGIKAGALGNALNRATATPGYQMQNPQGEGPLEPGQMVSPMTLRTAPIQFGLGTNARRRGLPGTNLYDDTLGMGSMPGVLGRGL